MVLDFTITSTVGDNLNTLTITKSGTARDDLDFDTPKLWADNEIAGFQCWGFDQELATATKVNGIWVFQNINFDFTDASPRFFVSIETGDLIQDKIAQFLLDQGNDVDGDGSWDSGERGIFLDSGVIGTISGALFSKPQHPLFDSLPLKHSNTSFTNKLIAFNKKAPFQIFGFGNSNSRAGCNLKALLIRITQDLNRITNFLAMNFGIDSECLKQFRGPVGQLF